MQLSLTNREEAYKVGAWLVDSFDQSNVNVRNSWLVEHTEDDGHADVTAWSITVVKGSVNPETGTQSTGNLTVGGTSATTGDVFALSGTSNICGIGTLATVSGSALLGSDAQRQGLLLGGTSKGMFLEWRPAVAPFIGDRELTIRSFAIDANTPVLRFGLIGTAPTLIDGGTGSTPIHIGDSTRPIGAINVNAVTGNADADFAGGTLHVDSVNGRVGIGTTSPNSKLNIKGTEADPSSTSYTGLFTLDGAARTSVQFGIFPGTHFDGSWIQSTNEPASDGGTFALVLNPLGGNVGVGTGSTTSPRGLLHVHGSGDVVAFSSGGVAIGSTTDPGSGALSCSGNAALVTNGVALGLFGATSANVGAAGAGVLVMKNGTQPLTAFAGGGELVCVGGALVFVGGSGTVTTIAPA